MMAIFIDAHGDFVLDDGPACRHWVGNDSRTDRALKTQPDASRAELDAIRAECERLGGTGAAARAAGLRYEQLRALVFGHWIPKRATAQRYLEKLQAVNV